MSTVGCFTPLNAGEGIPLRLSMQRLWLTGRILPAGARLLIQHVFRSEEEKPLEVGKGRAGPRPGPRRSL